MRGCLSVSVAARALCSLSGFRLSSLPVPGERWREIAWPFPRDGWPAGRAFRCALCGAEIELYVRPKAGFCDCDLGVADDDEVDRVTDLDLISERFVPPEPGPGVQVAGMKEHEDL